MADYKVPIISGAVPSANDVLHWNGSDWVCHDMTASVNAQIDSAISDVVATAVAETASLATAIASVESTLSSVVVSTAASIVGHLDSAVTSTAKVLSDATSDARSLASAGGGGGVTESHMDSAIASTETTLSDAASEVQSSVDSIIGHDGDGYRLCDIDGTPTKVYTKYLTGTTDAGDDQTHVAHNITGIDNILSVTVSIYNSPSARYEFGDNRIGVGGNASYLPVYDGTNVVLRGVGVDFRNQKYRIRIDYIL